MSSGPMPAYQTGAGAGRRGGSYIYLRGGVRFGLCRRYANEWWHFERLAPAIGQRCPPLERYAGG
jgi:hypothetical protein